MSERKRRLDTQTRIQNDPERRKRRNLSDYPGLNIGTATGEVDVPPGGCPNLAPVDAATPRCTVQATAETAGDAYADVQIDATALIPGTDVISYCFEGKVGPPGGAIEIACDGEFALIVDGLLHKDLVNGTLQDGDISAFWDRWETKGGTWEIKWDEVAGHYFLRGHNDNWIAAQQECDYLLSLIAPERDTFAVQAQVRFNEAGQYWYEEGGGNWGPTGVRRGGAGVCGAWTAAVIPPEQKEVYIAFGFQGFGGGIYTSLGRYNGLVYTALSGTSNYGNQMTLFIEDDYQEGYYINQGQTGSPATATDAVNKDIAGKAGLAITSTAYNSVGYNAWAEFHDIYICKTKRITVTGVPTGYYVGLITYEDAAPTDAAGETSGTTVFNSDSTTTPVGGEGISWHRWPFRGFRVYDDDPAGAGILVTECLPQRGVFPGDTWNMDLDGGQVVDDSVLDAQATIQLQLFNSSDEEIAVYEPSGSISEGYARGTNTEVLDIPIPQNLAGGYLRFTPYKRGTSDAFACVRRIQVNTGGELCCVFTAPGSGDAQGGLEQSGLSAISTLSVAFGDLDADGAPEPHVTKLLDESRFQPFDPDLPPEDIGDKFWTAEEVGDAIESIEEHREGSINIMGFDGYEEQDGPGNGTVGNPSTGCGYKYERIDAEEWGIEAGDPLSLRFKGKVV